MPTQIITPLVYPTKTPSTNDFKYLAWITKDEVQFIDYREWTLDAWVLNIGEVVDAFIEIARLEVV